MKNTNKKVLIKITAVEFDKSKAKAYTKISFPSKNA